MYLEYELYSGGTNARFVPIRKQFELIKIPNKSNYVLVGHKNHLK